MNLLHTTALHTGTVLLPPEPPPMTVWGRRLGDEWEENGIACYIGSWAGVRFLETKRVREQ